MSVTTLSEKMIMVDGKSIQYSLSGNEGPVIILINGYRVKFNSWSELFPEISEIGQVLAFNRAGVGKSSKTNVDQTGAEVVKTLKKLLVALQLSPPYVLVAHSLGGVFANLFCREYPCEVASVIFVEAAHPEENERQSKFRPPLLVRKLNYLLKSIDLFFDKYQHSEDDCLSTTLSQIDAADVFPEIDVVVITGCKKMPFVPEESFKVHVRCQRDLLALSPKSRQVLAAKSGHFPQISEPEIVLDAITDEANKLTI